MNEQTVNLNSAQCLHETTSWGETMITNICNGHVAHIPWGSMDYAGTIFLLGMGLALIAALIGFAKMIIFD